MVALKRQASAELHKNAEQRREGHRKARADYRAGGGVIV